MTDPVEKEVTVVNRIEKSIEIVEIKPKSKRKRSMTPLKTSLIRSAKKLKTSTPMGKFIRDIEFTSCKC